MDFPDRNFVVSYYTPRRRALLLSSHAEWGGHDELIRIAFFGVSEFFIPQALDELVVGMPSLQVGSDGPLNNYPISWKEGKGFVIARDVDVERVHGKNMSIFRDKWKILEKNPVRPADDPAP